MDTKISKFNQEILDKMFKMVGFEGFDRKFTKQEAWYTKRQWTEAESNQFHDYFINKARQELKWSKRTAEKEYQYFNLMYGWKVKNDTKTIDDYCNVPPGTFNKLIENGEKRIIEDEQERKLRISRNKS